MVLCINVASNSLTPKRQPCIPKIAAAAWLGFPYSITAYPANRRCESRGTLAAVNSPKRENSNMHCFSVKLKPSQ